MKYTPIIACTLIAFSCQALPVGNPMEPALLQGSVLSDWVCEDLRCPGPDRLDLRLGFYGDYVFQRNLEVYSLGGQSDTNADLLHTQLFTSAAYLSATWNRCIEIYATLGASKIRLDGDSNSFGLLGISAFPLVQGGPPEATTLGGLVQIKSLDAFSWSFGGRGVIYELGCLRLGVEGQYFQTRPQIKWIQMTNTYISRLINPFGVLYSKGLGQANSLLNMVYQEWQAGLALACDAGVVSPYAAVKISGAKLYMDNAKAGYLDVPGTYPILGNCQSSKHWGYAIGLSAVSANSLALTLEGRFGDETAVYANGQFRF
jgi:hypothetical protein